MSSPRRKLDQYFTPGHASVELIKYAPDLEGRNILECCCGDGSIINTMYLYYDKLYVKRNDIDPSLHADYHLDVSLSESWKEFPEGCDWVISNPPFNQASLIIPNAFNYATVGIAMLLRGSYTEPTFDRQHWLKEHEQHLAHIIYLPRISFTGDGKTDSVSCNWYIWTKERVSGCQLNWVTKEKR